LSQDQQPNGVDVDKLLATIDTIKENLELANFQFRAETERKSGGHSRTQIQSFHGAGAEDTSRSNPFAVEADEPPVLLGSNAGPNAVEIVLAGLGSCLAVGFAYNAAARDIRVSCHVKSDGSREQLVELCEHVQKTSPVLDIIRNPVGVFIALEA